MVLRTCSLPADMTRSSTYGSQFTLPEGDAETGRSLAHTTAKSKLPERPRYELEAAGGASREGADVR